VLVTESNRKQLVGNALKALAGGTRTKDANAILDALEMLDGDRVEPGRSRYSQEVLKGLVRQWQAEMRLHFGEKLQFIDPAELAAFRQWRVNTNSDEENLWRLHDQVICSLDSVKPMEGRKGWSLEQLNNYNRERFEDLISASWDLVIIDESHRMGGSTDQVARYKLGAALAEASPYLLLLSATPHQGKTDQFLRLMQLINRESFPDEGSVSRDRVRPFVIRTEKRNSIDAEGQPLFKPRFTRLQPVAWQDRHGAQQRLYEAVTDYVRHGYNQALAAKQRHIGFLMILMQRLVTSSTASNSTSSGSPAIHKRARSAGNSLRMRSIHGLIRTPPCFALCRTLGTHRRTANCHRRASAAMGDQALCRPAITASRQGTGHGAPRSALPFNATRRWRSQGCLIGIRWSCR
jgi:hypothetical protein